jgi:hypothetical protein
MNKQIFKERIWKIAKGGIIVGLSAVITYLAENVGKVDFGNYTPVAVGAISVLIQATRQGLLIWKGVDVITESDLKEAKEDCPPVEPIQQ